MTLEILTPESVFYRGDADSVTLPGTLGSFQILNNHAPIISSLTKGVLSFTVNGEIRQIEVSDGVMEMHNNKVTVCIDEIH
ncbi:FoF1 ATP synthase subunit delta/epsilon [Proteiniphilum acetatigenes]|uniref:FoF1 ATP synthase subunit delta/epsilon n=1 Tax=Proteiniphilum acetatigenes TaxID=294710 RepID=UPI000362962F|nr:F0F1 ATP synthase subunit epsilon [Proteiniphilum acetatigenes]SFK94633.1 F-type H+-transporting ATPase subunit epsilon [Porphyromonadaceae bacterium KH3CP3RA]